MVFVSEEEAIAHFRNALGPFTNQGPGFQRERVEAILEAAKLKGEEIKAISKEVRSKKVPGFLLPFSLPSTFSQVVVSPESEPEYAAEVKQLLTQAGCGDVPVIQAVKSENE